MLLHNYFVETKNAAIHTSWTTTYRWLNVKQFICESVLHRRIGISSHQGGTWIGCLIPPWEKIISVMFPLSVRRYSLFTLYIRNFLHIPLLEYMLQKASPQGENDTLWAHIIVVQIYSRFRRHSRYSLEDPVHNATSYAAYLYDYEWLFSNRNHNPLSKPNR